MKRHAFWIFLSLLGLVWLLLSCDSADEREKTEAVNSCNLAKSVNITCLQKLQNVVAH